MIVLSLFDGVSCGRAALERAGIKVDKYYASEIDTYAEKVSQDNWPDIIRLGDIENWREWDIETPDIIIGGSPCFISGTKVIVFGAYKNIEDVKVGDMVLTHTGEYKPVLRTGCTKKETILLDAQGIAVTETTSKHPYYVRTRSRKWNNDIRRYERVFTSPYWKEAGGLTKNDYISIPIVSKESNPRNLNIELCWIIGRYIADGHIQWGAKCKNNSSYRHPQVILSIGKNKKQKVMDNMPTINHSFGEHSKGVYRVRICNKYLVELISSLGCGEGALNKTFPMELLELPIELAEAVIEGYMSGDGYYYSKQKRFQASSISKELIMMLQLLVAKVYGINSSIYFEKTANTTVIEGRTVNQRDYWELHYKTEVTRNRVAFIDNGEVWVPIRNITKTNKIETVYNLEVADNNSYTANNAVVHNCQGFSFAGKQLNFNDPRSKLFFTFADIVRHYHPKFFLLENVKMKQEHQDVISYTMGEIYPEDARQAELFGTGKIDPVAINSALLSAQNRQRLYWCNWQVSQPEDKGILLKGIVEDGIVEPGISKRCTEYIIAKKGEPNSSLDRKSKCLVVAGHSGGTHSDMDLIPMKNLCKQVGVADLNVNESCKRVYSIEGKAPTLTAICGGNQEPKINTSDTTWRKLTVTECCRLQTLPDDYCKAVSNSRAYHALGNGWTVDIITHILKQISKEQLWLSTKKH